MASLDQLKALAGYLPQSDLVAPSDVQAVLSALVHAHQYGDELLDAVDSGRDAVAKVLNPAHEPDTSVAPDSAQAAQAAELAAANQKLQQQADQIARLQAGLASAPVDPAAQQAAAAAGVADAAANPVTVEPQP